MSNNISGITWQQGQAIVTHSEPCGIDPGEDLAISGVTPSGFNGAWSMLFFADTDEGSSCIVQMDDPGGDYVSGGVVG